MEEYLRIGNGEEWSFLNGAWLDGPQGELMPPDGTDGEYVAVRKNEVYGDFTARFRFRLRNIATVRFLFRVQDSRRFYALDIPFGGQQWMSRACWAGMVIADGSPIQRYLNFGHVPGMCSRIDHWYEVRIEATGPRLRAWIDDILVADVLDHTYSRGHIGLAFIQDIWCDAPYFDRMTIEGTPQPQLEPLRLEAPAQHWITPCPETDPDSWQGYANLIKSASGEVTLFLIFGDPNGAPAKRKAFIRSHDGGRNWGPQEPATLDAGFGAPFVRRDGAWVCLHPDAADPTAPPNAYESGDEGRTWTGPQPLRVADGWPTDLETFSMWRTVRLSDGSLVTPLICHPANLSMISADGENQTYRQYLMAMVIRSEDDGHTWSKPVLCDAYTDQPPRPWEDPLSLRLYGGRVYEVAMDETDPGVLLGIGRPGIDPYMWQLRSQDGGRTWDPASIGHFPGYCPSLTRTADGSLVATTRFPHFTAHLSRDGGRTWDLPVIVDYCQWANQQAVEIEPNVVLVSYMGPCTKPGQADSRIARLRVTDQGLVLDH